MLRFFCLVLILLSMIRAVLFVVSASDITSYLAGQLAGALLVIILGLLVLWKTSSPKRNERVTAKG